MNCRGRNSAAYGLRPGLGACRWPTSCWRNPADHTTSRDLLAGIERQYGQAGRIWAMDRGVPTEAVLQEMRNCDSPVQYLVGTPKGRLARWRKRCLPSRGRRGGPGVDVKLLLQEGELYMQTQSRDSGGERAGDAAAGPAILPISSMIWQSRPQSPRAIQPKNTKP